MKAAFDCRIIQFLDGKDHEIVNHMLWRSVKDCYRNAVSTFARTYFSSKELQNKNKDEMVQMMNIKGFNFEKKVPLYLKYGVYGKKEIYKKIIYYGDDQQEITRQRVCNKSFKILYNDNVLNLLLEKTWKDDLMDKSNLVFEDFIIN